MDHPQTYAPVRYLPGHAPQPGPLLSAPACLRLLPSPPVRRRRRFPVLVNTLVFLGVVGFCAATWAVVLGLAGEALGGGPSERTYERPTVPYVADARPVVAPAPIPLRPYVPVIPAGLPTSCPADGCASYWVPRV